MQEQRTSVRAGQRVDVRDEPWIVISTEPFDRVSLVTLRGIGNENLGETARFLTPFDTVTPTVRDRAATGAPRQAVLAHAAAVIAASPRWGDPWTAGTARIELRPWQIEPALAAIAGAARILLADEVGLGKTIQAGLIVSELMARGMAQRVLVLTPASLRDQWASELWDKFRIAASVFDHARLTAAMATLPVGVNPWNTASIAISSIDLVKRPEIRTALDEVPLDVLIVDEAHHLAPRTDRGAVVADLASRTPWIVLATATPHSGDEAAYRFLLGLGSVNDRQPALIYRRAAGQVQGTMPRRTHLLGVAPTTDERALLDSTLAYSRALWRNSANTPAAGLVASVIARRAASSAVAARRTLERRLALIAGSSSPEVQTTLPWEEDQDDDEAGDVSLAVAGLANKADEISQLANLVALARTAEGRSSKVDVIRRLLKRTDEQLIVFSEYRDVIRDVGSRISDLSSVVMIHGGVPASVRRDCIRAFTDGRARVLITTDAAGEGLNLQARCRLVVNLELPWNPLRLEQRVGRVDRLGQRRRVHAIHLFHRGSFEDVVLAHLERRRTRASAASVECDSNVDVDVLTTERQLRSLVARHGKPRRTAGPLYSRETWRTRSACHVVLLFAADLVDDTGRMVQRCLVPLRVRLSSQTVRARLLSKGLMRRLAADPEVLAILDQEVQRRLAAVHTSTSLTAAALRTRLRALQAHLESRRNDRWSQGSLFDRRAEQQSQVQVESLHAWRDHFARRISSAYALARLQSSDPRLVAAWAAE